MSLFITSSLARPRTGLPPSHADRQSHPFSKKPPSLAFKKDVFEASKKNRLNKLAASEERKHLSPQTLKAFSMISEPEHNRMEMLKNSDDQGWLQLLKTTALNAEYRDIQGFSPLHYAAFIDDRTTMRRFLYQGVNPDPLSVQGESPLMLAAMRGHSWLVRSLLEFKADANYRYETPWPQSPMVYAAREGHTDVLHLLLSKDIIQQNKNEALAGAARYGQVKAVDLLLRNGAEPNHKDKQGFSPLMNTLRTNAPGAEAVALRLVEEGADVHETVKHTGGSVLTLATCLNYVSLLEQLLQKGVGKSFQSTAI